MMSVLNKCQLLSPPPFYISIHVFYVRRMGREREKMVPKSCCTLKMQAYKHLLGILSHTPLQLAHLLDRYLLSTYCALRVVVGTGIQQCRNQ